MQYVCPKDSLREFSSFVMFVDPTTVSVSAPNLVDSLHEERSTRTIIHTLLPC